MCHPGTITAVGNFAQLVGAHFFHCGFIRGRVILDRNLCGHAAHGAGVAPVAGLDQTKRIGAQERRHHRYLGAIGQAEILVETEFLDR